MTEKLRREFTVIMNKKCGLIFLTEPLFIIFLTSRRIEQIENWTSRIGSQVGADTGGNDQLEALLILIPRCPLNELSKLPIGSPFLGFPPLALGSHRAAFSAGFFQNLMLLEGLQFVLLILQQRTRSSQDVFGIN